MVRKPVNYPDNSPEGKAKRALDELSYIERKESESERAWADYQARLAAQDANMRRLRELRLAKEAAEKAATPQPKPTRRGRPKSTLC